MQAERFGRLRAIFEAAADLPPGERAGALAALCPDEPDLRHEAAALLAAEEGASAFLDGFSPPVAAALASRPPSLLGRRLGPYRIERKLAEGGMSTLYLGVRTDLGYEQRVAIKVFGFSPDRADLLQRFQAERQILASLSHPAIARLLDGGAIPEGLPYLVMELIAGLPIDRYCAAHRLATAERIDLVLEVCAAVAFAHRNLVVHRDLKPSNILVDEGGHPKLLDFGIAKLLAGAPGQAGPDETRTGQRLMTPHYASPEQVSGGQITTATDVYALGVLLYLLLTERLPYRLARETPSDLERAIVEQPPEPPSQAAPRRWRRALKGDLDNIVLKALRKEARERYPTVDQLAEDLRRHRRGLPVAALPATLGYRVRKFVGRHPVATAAWSCACLLILALAVSMTLQAMRLRRERDRAVEVTGFLEEIFRSADADANPGREVTARELLDRGGERVLARLSGQPEAQAALALTIGRAYQSLGLADRAAPLLERALAQRRREFGAASPEAAEVLESLVEVDLRRGDLARAEAAARETLAIRRPRRAQDESALAESLNGLGLVLLTRADYAGAEPLFLEALRVERNRPGPAPRAEAVAILGNLAVLERFRGDLAAAGRHYQEAVTLARRLYGSSHPLTAKLLGNLAVLEMRRGDRSAAEANFREALAVARRAYGEEHPAIALQLNNLAAVLVDRGAWSEAEALYRQVLGMQRKLLGNDHDHVAVTLNNLADLMVLRGDLPAARDTAREALRIVRKVFGEGHPRVADQLSGLGRVLVAQGDLGAAEPALIEALEIRRRVLGEKHPAYASSLIALGGLRLAQGSASAAEPLLRQGLAVLRATLPARHQDIALAEGKLGSCLAVRGRRAEAEPLLTAASQDLLRSLGPTHPFTIASLRQLDAFRRSATGY